MKLFTPPQLSQRLKRALWNGLFWLLLMLLTLLSLYVLPFLFSWLSNSFNFEINTDIVFTVTLGLAGSTLVDYIVSKVDLGKVISLILYLGFLANLLIAAFVYIGKENSNIHLIETKVGVVGWFLLCYTILYSFVFKTTIFYYENTERN